MAAFCNANRGKGTKRVTLADALPQFPCNRPEPKSPDMMFALLKAHAGKHGRVVRGGGDG
jgi:hypothetical protein